MDSTDNELEEKDTKWSKNYTSKVFDVKDVVEELNLKNIGEELESLEGTDIPLPINTKNYATPDYKHLNPLKCPICCALGIQNSPSMSKKLMVHARIERCSFHNYLYIDRENLNRAIDKIDIKLEQLGQEKDIPKKEVELLIFLRLVAAYSRHVLAVLLLGGKLEDSDRYISEYILVNPEYFPREYIPYMCKTYCNGYSSFAADNFYSIGKVRDYDDWPGWGGRWKAKRPELIYDDYICEQ